MPEVFDRHAALRPVARVLPAALMPDVTGTAPAAMADLAAVFALGSVAAC
ncbi:MAG TPA: hypothetical protein VF223_02660 [Trebonia sp.]